MTTKEKQIAPQAKEAQMLQDEPFPDGLPCEDWETGQLEGWVTDVLGDLDSIERARTGEYWNLGEALLLLRKKKGHGTWLPYLDSIGVEKTRWERAKAIREKFSSANDCAHLTVEEAYAMRERKQSQAKKKRPAGVKSISLTSNTSDSGALLPGVRNEPLPGHGRAAAKKRPSQSQAEKYVLQNGSQEGESQTPPTPDELTAFVNFVRATLVAEDAGESFTTFYEHFNGNLERLQFVLDAAFERVRMSIDRKKETMEHWDD